MPDSRAEALAAEAKALAKELEAKKAADDAKMREREEKAKKIVLEKEAAAEAGVAGQKYRTEKAAAEAAAEEKRKKTAEHEAKQLARAELKIKSRSNTPERLRDDSTTAVSPQTDAKWREREEKARQKAAALAEERDTSVKGTTAVKSRRHSVAASAPGQSTTLRLNALLKVWKLHSVSATASTFFPCHLLSSFAETLFISLSLQTISE